MIKKTNQFILSKNCSNCKLEKPSYEFLQNKKHKNNLGSYCKYCRKTMNEIYRKSERGVISKIYGHQKSSSKKRGHKLPNYTKQELTTWLYKNNFKELFNNWVKSDYKTSAKPSCDRLNDFIGYSFKNMRLVVWKENNDKAHQDSIKGIGSKGRSCRKVNQYTLDGVFIKTHLSMSIAGRETKISNKAIYYCCKRKTICN